MIRARWLLIAAAVASLVLVLVVYRPAKDAPFLWDDHTLVERNAEYRHASLPSLFFGPFWPESGGLGDVRAGAYYRPLVLVSFRIDHALGGDPRRFHSTNLALHLIACALVGLVAVRFGARPGAAILAATSWAIHPRVTESVAWISGRTDLLALVFGLSAIAMWPDRDHPKPWPRTAVAALLLLCALFAKEVALAAVLALVWRARNEKHAALGLGVPTAVYVVLRTAAHADVVPQGRDLGFSGRVLTVLEALGHYLEMIVRPFDPRTSIGAIGAQDMPRVAFGVVVVLALGFLAWRIRRLHDGARVPLTLVVVAVLAASQIVPVATAGGVVADRFMTWPLAGLAMTFAVAARTLPWKPAAALTLLFVAASTRATTLRLVDYGDEARFWLVATEKAHPGNAAPRNALANLVRDSDHVPLGCRLFEASVRHGLDGAPARQRAREGLAACRLREDRTDEALAMYDALAAENPSSGRIQMGLGFARLRTRNLVGADEAFARSVVLDPKLAPVVGPARLAAASAGDALRTNLSAFESAGLAASLGDASQAQEKYTLVALAPELPLEQRRAALGYLAQYGQPDVTRAVLRKADASTDVSRFEQVLAPRLARVAQVEALLPRIEAVAR